MSLKSEEENESCPSDKELLLLRRGDIITPIGVFRAIVLNNNSI